MILSPTTTGDDAPGGTGTFHARFSVGLNLTGGFWSSTTPDPAGPRNCGQSAARIGSVRARARHAITNRVMRSFREMGMGEQKRPRTAVWKQRLLRSLACRGLTASHPLNHVIHVEPRLCQFRGR